MTSLLIRNAVVLTFDAKAPVLYDHAVLIEGTKIKKIAPDSEFADFKGKTIDARGRKFGIGSYLFYFCPFD